MSLRSWHLLFYRGWASAESDKDKGVEDDLMQSSAMIDLICEAHFSSEPSSSSELSLLGTHTKELTAASLCEKSTHVHLFHMKDISIGQKFP